VSHFVAFAVPRIHNSEQGRRNRKPAGSNRRKEMKKYLKQLGQGMTEYIIIVALIAIAAIAVYSFFGDTLRGQMGAMTQELAGKDATSIVTGQVQATAQQATDDASKHKGLDSYTGSGN
jgi:pilus assembly protein Flp/PilA